MLFLKEFDMWHSHLNPAGGAGTGVGGVGGGVGGLGVGGDVENNGG